MHEPSINKNILRQVFFIAAIVLLGYVLFRELAFFIPAFLGALTLYMLLRQRQFYLTEEKKWKHGLAAALLMFLSFLIIMVPVLVLGHILYTKINEAVAGSGAMLSTLQTTAEQIKQRTGFEVADENTLKQMGNYVVQWVPRILKVSGNVLMLLGAMYFILYFMLANARRMENMLHDYLPLKESNVNRLGEELKNMIISNTIGIPVIALIQGVVGLIGYLIIGVPEPWLWFVATCIAAMMPVVGAALVYVPLAVSLLVQGKTGQGIALALWGFAIIGVVDNLFRFLLNKKLGNIHPLITIFGVIAGVQLFGFIGLVFGPLLISLFLLLLRIYASEFVKSP